MAAAVYNQSHQQCTRVPFSPHLPQHLLLVVFLLIDILTGVRWYLTVDLISISLMFGDTEHLLKCACWPSVCLLQRNVYSDSLLIF